MLFAVTVK